MRGKHSATALLERRQITVAVVDDHPAVLAGLRTLERHRGRISVTGAFPSAKDFVLALRAASRWQVVISDLVMGRRRSGLGVITEAHRAALPVIVHSVRHNARDACDAFRAGASAYVLKSEPLQSLANLVEDAADGRLPARFVSDSQLRQEVQELQDLGLSPRQAEMLDLVTQGRTTRQCAEAMDVSYYTAKDHIDVLFKKLGTDDRYAVAERGRRLGFGRPSP